MTNEWIDPILAYLPILLLAIGLFIAGWIVARLVRGLVNRLATRFGFDEFVERLGLMDNLRQAKIEYTPSGLMGQLFFWLVFLGFAIAAFDTMQLDIVVVLLQQLIAYLPLVFAAIVILIIGSWLAQLVGKFVEVTTASMGVDFHRQLGQAVKSIFMVMVGIIAIEQLGFDVSLLTDLFRSMLTIAIAALGLAFGLGARHVARNALAGYYVRDLYSPGDELRIDGQSGTLEAIGSLNSEIETEHGSLVVPNSRLIEKSVLIQKRYIDPLLGDFD